MEAPPSRDAEFGGGGGSLVSADKKAANPETSSLPLHGVFDVTSESGRSSSARFVRPSERASVARGRVRFSVLTAGASQQAYR